MLAPAHYPMLAPAPVPSPQRPQRPHFPPTLQANVSRLSPDQKSVSLLQACTAAAVNQIDQQLQQCVRGAGASSVVGAPAATGMAQKLIGQTDCPPKRSKALLSFPPVPKALCLLPPSPDPRYCRPRMSSALAALTRCRCAASSRMSACEAGQAGRAGQAGLKRIRQVAGRQQCRRHSSSPEDPPPAQQHQQQLNKKARHGLSLQQLVLLKRAKNTQNSPPGYPGQGQVQWARLSAPAGAPRLPPRPPVRRSPRWRQPCGR